MKGDGLGKFLGFLFMFLLLVGAAVGGGYFYADGVYRQAGPTTTDGSPRTVIIEPKSTVSSIAKKLVEAGAIRNDLVFRGAVRLTNATMRLKAGEYAFDSGESRVDQGISKQGNRRVRALLIEMAWMWLRYQPDSALANWFVQRTQGSGPNKRGKRIAIVAVARKLAIGLWRYVKDGEMPKGAVLKTA